MSARERTDPDTAAVRWHEIVGVSENFLTNPVNPEAVMPEVYHPVAPAQVDRVSLNVRVRGTMPTDFASRLREIGIRSALGAQPRQMLRSIFVRAAVQIASGVSAGVTVAMLVERLTGGGLLDGRGSILLPGFALAMAIVALLATLGPARRGLKIQPTEALRSD